MSRNLRTDAKTQEEIVTPRERRVSRNSATTGAFRRFTVTPRERRVSRNEHKETQADLGNASRLARGV